MHKRNIASIKKPRVIPGAVPRFASLENACFSHAAPLPTLRKPEGNFGGADFGQRRFWAEFLGGDEAGLFGLDAVEEPARGFHVRVGGAPIGGQFALNRILQDGLLEFGEEGLLAGYFTLRGGNVRAALVDPFDELMLFGERREIYLIVQKEAFLNPFAIGVSSTGPDAGFQKDR